MKAIKTNPVRVHRKFDETFKREAVLNWLNSGKSAAVVGEELGLNANLAYVRGSTWCPVDHRLYGTLRRTGANYTTADFAQELQAEPAEANRTMDFLIRKGVLIAANK